MGCDLFTNQGPWLSKEWALAGSDKIFEPSHDVGALMVPLK